MGKSGRGRGQAVTTKTKVQQLADNIAARSQWLSRSATGADHVDQAGHEVSESHKRPYPWIIAVAAIVALTSIFPATWAFAWTRDPSPAWAQPTFLLVGLIAIMPFLHALVATQGLAATKGCTAAESKLPRTVSEKVLYRVAAGILSGTLYALVIFSDAPSGIKATSAVADLATIGGVLGLLTCMRYSIVTTKSSLESLRRLNQRKSIQIWSAIVVIDSLMLYKLAFLLPFITRAFSGNLS
jgi:hypothetical protein